MSEEHELIKRFMKIPPDMIVAHDPYYYFSRSHVIKIVQDWLDEQNKPVVKVPPGWERVIASNYIDSDWYMFRDGKWIKTDCSVQRYDLVIQQVIDIDLSKQPPELVAWAMDYEGTWAAYNKIPTLSPKKTWCTGYERILMKSEHPKTWKGDFMDSLLVRPEYWNEVEQ